jgi:catechol 2,3-dioxygenase
MRVQRLGHVVLRVREREQAEQFYTGVLGIPIAARMDKPAMTFFTLGSHHDFGVMAVGPDGVDAAHDSPGLAHVAFKVGDGLDDLRDAKRHLEAAGVAVDMIADHTVSQSIYVRDPDGNVVELYVDGSDAWRSDPQSVATIAPLTL